MSAVLWQTGRWSEAERTSREVIGSTDATQHAHAVAEGILGIVAALRGTAGRARPHLEASLQIARRIELTAMELISSWGLALCDRLEGDEAGAVDRCRRLLARWDRTEERHYVVPPLRWAATVLAEQHDAAGVRACADALARIAAQTAQPEAIAALATTLGEAAGLEATWRPRPRISPARSRPSRPATCHSSARRSDGGRVSLWSGGPADRRGCGPGRGGPHARGA